MFSRNRPDRDARAAGLGAVLFGDRANRALFWGALLGMTAVAAIAPRPAIVALLPLLLLILAARLHDFGRSGWWAASLPASWLTVACVGHAPLLAVLANVAAFLFTLVFIFIVGLWPGDADANRFGEAPKSRRAPVSPGYEPLAQ